MLEPEYDFLRNHERLGKELFSWDLEAVTLTELIMIIVILTLEVLHFRVLLIYLVCIVRNNTVYYSE